MSQNLTEARAITNFVSIPTNFNNNVNVFTTGIIVMLSWNICTIKPAY